MCCDRSPSVSSPAPQILSLDVLVSLCVPESPPHPGILQNTIENSNMSERQAVHETLITEMGKEIKTFNLNNNIKTNNSLTCIPGGIFQSVHEHVCICRAVKNIDKHSLHYRVHIRMSQRSQMSD